MESTRRCGSSLADFCRIRLADEDFDLIAGLHLVERIVAAGELELAGLRTAVLRREVADVNGGVAGDLFAPLFANLRPLVGGIARIGVTASGDCLLPFEARLHEIAGAVDGRNRRLDPIGGGAAASHARSNEQGR